jgi:hypothetical protein
MITQDTLTKEAKDHDWPGENDAEFWPKVAKIIDAGIEEHSAALKDWWVVRRVPFWYPHFGHVELNYLIGVQKYYLEATAAKRERLKRGLKEPYLGHTQETYDAACYNFGFDGILTGTWPIKNAYHIMKWEQHSKRDITDYDHIIEIGAGLGDMARYCFDVGFKGSYTILDLEPTAKIQKAYLSGQYPVTWVHDVKDIIKDTNTLVIAMWSLSEIDYEERYRIVTGLSDLDWLVTFQCRVMTRLNEAWFPKYFQNLVHRKVTYEAIPFHEYQGGSFYAYATELKI